jgi:hypothetical protein
MWYKAGVISGLGKQGELKNTLRWPEYTNICTVTNSKLNSTTKIPETYLINVKLEHFFAS